LQKYKKTVLFLLQFQENDYFCSHRKRIVMARPIKETPILFGDDARKFEERMNENRKETPEEKAERMAAYYLIMSILKS